MPGRTTDRHRSGRSVGAAAAGVLAAVMLAMWVLAPPVAGAVAAATPPPDTINEFIPENRNLGDCLGTLQRPGCGSEASGGWRQGLIFFAMLTGLLVIAARIIFSARRRRVAVDTG